MRYWSKLWNFVALLSVKWTGACVASMLKVKDRHDVPLRLNVPGKRYMPPEACQLKHARFYVFIAMESRNSLSWHFSQQLSVWLSALQVGRIFLTPLSAQEPPPRSKAANLWPHAAIILTVVLIIFVARMWNTLVFIYRICFNRSSMASGQFLSQPRETKGICPLILFQRMPFICLEWPNINLFWDIWVNVTINKYTWLRIINTFSIQCNQYLAQLTRTLND